MGVEIRRTKEGNGEYPKKGQLVTVHCTGYVEATNKKFWSTKDPGQEAFSFNIGLGKVIRGWDEGVMQMKVGEHATLVISPDYGYGPQGFPAWGIPQNAILRFEIELLCVR